MQLVRLVMTLLLVWMSPISCDLIAISQSNACTITQGGVLTCWGDSAGKGTFSNSAHTLQGADFSTLSPPILPSINFTSISAGYQTYCGVSSDGALRCWGGDIPSSFGLSAGVFPENSLPLVFSDTEIVVSVAAGFYFTCALFGSGRVRCFGEEANYSQGALGTGLLCVGQGSGAASMATIPYLEFDDTAPAVAITAGTSGGCAIVTDGRLRCWGGNWLGESGHATRGYLKASTALGHVVFASSSLKVVDVARAAHSTCVVFQTGQVQCWGYDYLVSANPATGPCTGTYLGAGQYDNTLGNLGTNAACVSAIAGNGCVPITAGAMADLPPDLGPVAKVRVSLYNTCVISTSGKLLCWGGNSHGQLSSTGQPVGKGLANELNTWRPFAFPGVHAGLRVVDVAMLHTFARNICAYLENRRVFCWGTDNLMVTAGQTPVALVTAPAVMYGPQFPVSFAMVEAELQALSVAGYPLDPPFQAVVLPDAPPFARSYSLTGTVPFNLAAPGAPAPLSITVTCYPMIVAVITVTNPRASPAVTSSCVPSAAVTVAGPLAYGWNVVTVTVSAAAAGGAPNGKRTYSLSVYARPSEDTSLSGLSVSPAVPGLPPLTPAFPGSLAYRATVPSAAGAAAVTFARNSSLAVSSPAASPALVALGAPGSTTSFALQVQAMPPFGPTAVFQVDIRRLGNDSALAAIAGLPGGFHASVTSYSASFPSVTDSVLLTPACRLPEACVVTCAATPTAAVAAAGSFSVALPPPGQAADVALTVRPDDPTLSAFTVYRLSLRRLPNDTSLASLSDSAGLLAGLGPLARFDPATLTYVVRAPFTLASSAITLTAVCASMECSAAVASSAGVTAPPPPLGLPADPAARFLSAYLGPAGDRTVISLAISLANSATTTTVYSLIVNVGPEPRVVAVGPQSGPAAGGTLVTLVGSGFSSLGPDPLPAAAPTVAGVPCLRPLVISDTAITCITGPAPAAGQGPVTAFGVASASASSSTPGPTFTYVALAPAVTAVSPAEGPSTGGTTVTIWGSGLPTSQTLLRGVVLGGVECVRSCTADRSFLRCVTPASPVGETSRAPVVVTALLQPGAAALFTLTGSSFAFTVPDPAITFVSPRSVNPVGGTLVTLYGSSFGRAGATLSAEIDGSPCQRTAWVSAQEVVCTTPPGAETGRALPLVLAAADGRRSPPFFVPSARGFRYGPECATACEPRAECVSGRCSSDECVFGWVGAPLCNVPAMTLTPLTPSSPLATTEDGGSVTLLLKAAPMLALSSNQSASPVAVVRVSVSAPEEASLSGARFEFQGAVPREQVHEVVVTGLPDAQRDGPREYTVTAAVAGFHGDLSLSLALVNHDSSPSLSRVSPRSLPQLGGTITLSGVVNVDPDARVIFGGQSVALFQVPAGASFAALQGGGPAEFAVRVGPLNTTGLHDLSLLNPWQQQQQRADFTVPGAVLVTDDCPREGFYGRGLACTECPEGADCPGGFRLWPKPGYWNGNESAGTVTACEPNRERCLGGPRSLCARGYTGALCATCERGFLAVNGGLCLPCTSPRTARLLVMADALAWILVALAAALLQHPSTFTAMVTLVTVLQASALFGENLATPSSTPRAVVWALHSLKIFVGDYALARYRCGPGASHVEIVLGTLAYNCLILLVMLAAVSSVGWVRVAARRRQLGHPPAGSEGALELALKVRRVRDRLFLSCAVWCDIMFTNFVRVSMFSLGCTSRGTADGRWAYFLRAKPDTACWTASHTALFVLSVAILFAMFVAWPLCLGRILWRSDKTTYDRDGRFLCTFGVHTDSLRYSHRLFFLVFYLETLFVVFAETFVSSPATRNVVSLVGVGICLVAIVALRPFRDLFETVCALSLETALVLFLVVTHPAVAADGKTGSNESLVIAAMVALALCILLHVVAFLLSFFVGREWRGSNPYRVVSKDDKAEEPDSDSVSVQSERAPAPFLQTSARTLADILSTGSDSQADSYYYESEYYSTET